MKSSKVFKFMALASAGAYAVSKIRENPQLLGLVPTCEERAYSLIDRLQNHYNISPAVGEIAKQSIENYHERRFNNAKVVNAKS